MKNPEDRLALISIFLMLIGSGLSGNPCTLDSESDEHVNLSRDHCEVDSDSSNVHLICSGGLNDEWKNGSDRVRILTLCRWGVKGFDPEVLLAKFPTLENLSISDSSFTHLSSAFPSTAQYLRNVAVSGTSLRVLSKNAFSMLPALTVLDLRNNALQIVDSTSLAGPSLRDVYLSGNPWNCTSEMFWILDLISDPVASRIVDRDKLICLVKVNSIYYERPLVPVIEVLEELEKQCLKTEPCTCELTYVGRSPGSTQLELIVFVTVNCSSSDFTEMPKFLPENTTSLHLSNNRIHDLSPLKTNPSYKRVLDVYLDDNEIESIAILEGSDWLDQFRAFSLRGNRLTDLPPYALENALQQNRAAADVFLGRNPWRCDCHFTPGFQDLLNRHRSLFKDAPNITCSQVEGDENSGKQIIHLTRTAICTLPADWIQPLDVLNVVLASLIFFVFGKLLYDYWTFKKTGKLPWIVAKIP